MDGCFYNICLSYIYLHVQQKQLSGHTKISAPFFFYMGFLSRNWRITRLQGKGEGISLTSHYHFYPLHRHLDISRGIIAESSPLHIAGQQPDSNREPLVSERYVPLVVLVGERGNNLIDIILLYNFHNYLLESISLRDMILSYDSINWQFHHHIFPKYDYWYFNQRYWEERYWSLLLLLFSHNKL